MRLGLGAVLLGAVERLDQRQLGLLGRAELAAQALGLARRGASVFVGDAGEPGGDPGGLVLAPLDAAAQRGQLAADLGGVPARGDDALGPVASRTRSRSATSAASASASSAACGPSALGLGLDLGQLARAGRADSASRVAMTPWSTNALRSRSMPRRRSASSDDEAAGPLEQRLEPGEVVAEVVAAHGRQPGLGGEHRGVEVGELRA